jgi:hypothetical protein
MKLQSYFIAKKFIYVQIKRSTKSKLVFQANFLMKRIVSQSSFHEKTQDFVVDNDLFKGAQV